MRDLNRRSFVGAALAVFPLTVLGQSTKSQVQGATPGKAALVPGREDRQGEHHSIGISTTDFKVLTQESSGALFIFEHTNHKKGGPPRHLHHNEDEWFYVLEGAYIVEVGSERFQLKTGDSILAPRELPHAWAFAGDTPGKALIAFALPTRWRHSFATTRNTSAEATMPMRRRFTALTAWSFLALRSPSGESVARKASVQFLILSTSNLSFARFLDDRFRWVNPRVPRFHLSGVDCG